jgi:protein gp37
MNRASWHTFQILTKRADILHDYSKYLNWSDNIWMGVTVESGKYLERIDYLRKTGAAIKFVSFEPLLGNIDDIDFKNIDWAIVGGESGVGARPLKQEWVLNIKKQCDRQNVLFYFKQWGGKNKKKAGRMLLNKTWDDMPVIKEADI